MRNKKPEFIDKQFDQLGRTELHSLIRKIPRYTPEEMMKLYKIDGDTYIDKIKEVGLTPTREDRHAWSEWRKEHKIQTEVSEVEFYEPIDLMAMRLLRGYNTLKFAKISKIHESDLKKYERSNWPIPGWVGNHYVQVLGIKRNELQRLRMLIKGEIHDFEVDRKIPEKVKEIVWKRDKGKCTECESKQRIHYHHVKYFSKGGLHQENNLKLLCAACHAEVHKNDPSYYLLKHMAEV